MLGGMQGMGSSGAGIGGQQQIPPGLLALIAQMKQGQGGGPQNMAPGAAQPQGMMQSVAPQITQGPQPQQGGMMPHPQPQAPAAAGPPQGFGQNPQQAMQLMQLMQQMKGAQGGVAPQPPPGQDMSGTIVQPGAPGQPGVQVPQPAGGQAPGGPQQMPPGMLEMLLAHLRGGQGGPGPQQPMPQDMSGTMVPGMGG